MKIELDLAEVKAIEMKGSKAIVTPQAEDALVKLLSMEKAIADAKKWIQDALEKEALAINPNFTGFTADKIRIRYQSYGVKYIVDEPNFAQLPHELYETVVKTSVKLNGKEIEKFADAHEGKLPLGVIAPDRPKQLSFTLKNKKDE